MTFIADNWYWLAPAAIVLIGALFRVAKILAAKTKTMLDDRAVAFLEEAFASKKDIIIDKAKLLVDKKASKKTIKK